MNDDGLLPGWEADLMDAPPRINLARSLDQQTDEAFALLEGDYSHEPRWPWGNLTKLVGPPLAGELWFIGARPSCGKTTFLLNTMQSYVSQGVPLLYVGMEMAPAKLKLQWASWACDFDYATVARKDWAGLPVDARDRIRAHLEWQRSPEIRELVTFADDERVTIPSLKWWIAAAAERGLKVVMLDHLHRMAWGGGDLTAAMSEGVIELKTLAKEHGIRMMVAAQLKRRGASDTLDDYMAPSSSEIKQTGATEQEADTILLLHRSLKKDLAHGDLQKIRMGTALIETVAEDRVMRVRVGKCRLDGDARDHDVRLYLNKGMLYASEQDRQHAQWAREHGL